MTALPVALTGCGAGPEPAAASDRPLAEWTLALTLEAGEERVDCAWFVVPPSGLAVERFEHDLGDGIHHLIVFPTALAPEAVTAPGGGRVACGLDDVADTTGFAFGAQPGSRALAYPEGTALWFPPDQVVMLQVHALATGAAPLSTRATLRLHGTTAPPLRHAGTLHFYDWAIAVPPRSTAVTRARCVLPEPVELAFAHGHFHGSGRFRAWVRGAPGAAGSPAVDLGAPFVDTTRGAEPTRLLETPVRVEAGGAIEFECEHENPRDTWVYEGQSARDDEMCSLTAGYVPDGGDRLDLAAEACLTPGSGVLGQGGGACTSVEPCAAASAAPAAHVLAECLLAASPEASLAFVAHAGCRALQCAAPCGVAPGLVWRAATGSDPACQACLADRCADTPCAP